MHIFNNYCVILLFLIWCDLYNNTILLRAIIKRQALAAMFFNMYTNVVNMNEVVYILMYPAKRIVIQQVKYIFACELKVKIKFM